MSAKKKGGTEAVHAGGRGLSLSILLLGCLFSFLVCERVAIAEEKDVSNRRFNIVFVLDGSESMTYNDPNGLRFDAVSTMATLLVGQKNKSTGFVFNEEPLDSVELPPLNVSEDIEEFTNRFSECEPSGDTDIGKAISKALDMLEDEQQNLAPLVVLISDGTTDLPYATDEEREESRGIEKDAEDRASERGVKFLCVCIDTDNQHDSPELEEISEVTNGTAVYLNSKDDLPEVLGAFFNLLYETYLTPLKTERASDGVEYNEYGRVEAEFEYPAIGASEVMLVINGQVDEYELIGPAPENKLRYPLQAHYNDITLYRVREGDAGLWTLNLKGKPNTMINIKKAIIPKITIRTTILPSRRGKEKNKYNPNDEIIVQSKLIHSDGSVAHSKEYSGFKAYLHIRSLRVSDEEDEERLIPMKKDRGYFEARLSLLEGKYALKVRVNGPGAIYESEVIAPIEINENSLPESIRTNTEPELRFGKEKIGISVSISNPFKECPYDIDFSLLFYDREDQILSYSVGSNEYMPDNFSLVNSVIKIKDINAGNGEFIIRAVDSAGKNRDVHILLETHCYIIVYIVFIIIILVTYSFYRAHDYDPGIEIILEGTKGGGKVVSISHKLIGHLYIKEFGFDSTGIDYDKSYFYAKNKRDVRAWIYQISDKRKNDTSKPESYKLNEISEEHNFKTKIYNSKGEIAFSAGFKRVPKTTEDNERSRKHIPKLWRQVLRRL